MAVPVRRQSWSRPISIHFITVHSFAAKKSPKITYNQYFWGSSSFEVIDIDIPKNLVASACYGKQHVCVYLQAFSR